MAKVKVFFEEKKPKKNGECGIYLVVSLMYKTIYFSTGVSCSLDKFDTIQSKIRGASKKVKDDNLIIERCLATMNEIFVRYRLQNTELTPIQNTSVYFPKWLYSSVLSALDF